MHDVIHDPSDRLLLNILELELRWIRARDRLRLAEADDGGQHKHARDNSRPCTSRRP